MNQKESLLPLKIAVLTVSDTRTEADDKSGKILVDNSIAVGHSIAEKTDGVLSKSNSIPAIVLVI